MTEADVDAVLREAIRRRSSARAGVDYSAADRSSEASVCAGTESDLLSLDQLTPPNPQAALPCFLFDVDGDGLTNPTSPLSTKKQRLSSELLTATHGSPPRHPRGQVNLQLISPLNAGPPLACARTRSPVVRPGHERRMVMRRHEPLRHRTRWIICKTKILLLSRSRERRDPRSRNARRLLSSVCPVNRSTRHWWFLRILCLNSQYPALSLRLPVRTLSKLLYGSDRGNPGWKSRLMCER